MKHERALIYSRKGGLSIDVMMPRGKKRTKKVPDETCNKTSIELYMD